MSSYCCFSFLSVVCVSAFIIYVYMHMYMYRCTYVVVVDGSSTQATSRPRNPKPDEDF